MSFAAPKKSSRKTSPDSLRRVGNSFMENNLASAQLGKSGQYNIDPDYINRIDALEADLSKISKQQDALLPLMNMLEVAPALQKNENLLKGINKKSQETEDRLSRLEQLMRNYQQNIEQTVSKINSAPKIAQVDTSFIEGTLRDVSNQVNRQGTSIKELESNFGNLQKSIETKVTETVTNSTRTMEHKLERQRTEFNTGLSDLSKNVDLTFKKFEDAVKELYGHAEKFDEFVQTNRKEKILEEVSEIISAKFQEQFDYFNEKYDRDIDNLYREFGILRSEMDLINEEKRVARIQPHLQSLPKDVTPSEKKIKYNNVDQALNIQELDKFNKDTTQRIMYELQSFDEKLEIMKENFQQQNRLRSHHDEGRESDINENDEHERFKNEMEIMNERYASLKYQIEGAKKKYFFDMKKIEDKMEKINQIKREAQDEMKSDPKLKRVIPQEVKVSETFPDKIKLLMEGINKNLESTFTRLEIIEEKMKDNQDLLTKKRKTK